MSDVSTITIARGRRGAKGGGVRGGDAAARVGHLPCDGALWRRHSGMRQQQQQAAPAAALRKLFDDIAALRH